MKFFNYKAFKYSFFILAIGGITGCVSPVFDMNVKNPESSGVVYENANTSTTKIGYSSSRSEKEVLGTGAILTFNIKQDNTPLDELDYLISNTAKELNSRGAKVSFKKGVESGGDAQVKINALKMMNHRKNGFSPLVTLTSLSADLEYQGQTHKLVSFIKRGKVPIWTLTEEAIAENVFNQPLEILIQDFASGINRSIFGYKASDESVEELINAINSGSDDLNYLNVYKLGFTNNPKAIDTLVELTDSADEYIRLAAISSLGTVKAENQLSLLQSLYSSSKLWQDRGMALKSIGNIGSNEAMDFLKAELAKIDATTKPDIEQQWNKEIIQLFL